MYLYLYRANGSPLGMARRKKKQQIEEEFSIPEDAEIWVEVKIQGTVYGYVSRSFYPEIGTKIFSKGGDLTKVKKSVSKEAWNAFRTTKPRSTKTNPVHIVHYGAGAKYTG